MKTKIFYSKSCFTFCNKNCQNTYPKSIPLGQVDEDKRYAYFFFPISPLNSSLIVKEAKLLLYPIACKCDNNRQTFVTLSVTPTVDYISPCTRKKSLLCNNDHRLTQCFSIKDTTFSFDVTSLVSEWFHGTIENKGFLLSLQPSSCNISLAGPANIGLEPFLIITTSCNCKPLPPYHEYPVSLPMTFEIL